MILFANIMIGVMGIVTLLIVVTAVGSLWVRTPYIPTPTAVAEQMVQLANLHGNETVYDLGAGDGALLIAAKRAHPKIRAIGIEFVPTVWLIGKLRVLFSKQKISLRLGDALTANVSDADCIFLYLLPGQMQRLETHFDRLLKPGTKVVSHVFRFPHKTPVNQREIIHRENRKMMWLYVW